MPRYGIPLTDEGIMFPKGVPAESVIFRMTENENVLSLFDEAVAELKDDIADALDYLDFDSPVISLVDAYFESGKLVIEVVETMYSVCRAAQFSFRKKKENILPFLPWSMPNTLGLAVSVATTDEKIIWSVRSTHRLVRGRQIDPAIVESMSRLDDVGFSPRYLHNCIMDGFEDEVCPFPASEVPEMEVDGLFFDEDYAQWNILARMRAPYDSSKIKLLHAKRRDLEELATIHFMPLTVDADAKNYADHVTAYSRIENLAHAMENTGTWKTSKKARDLVERFDAARLKKKHMVCIGIDDFLDEDLNMLPSTKKTISALKESRNEVVFSTYRDYVSAKEIADNIGIDCFLFSSGSGVYTPDDKGYSYPLDPDHVKRMIQYCDEMDLGWAVSFESGRTRYTKHKIEKEKSKSRYETIVDPNLDVEERDVSSMFIFCSSDYISLMPTVEGCRFRDQKDGSYLVDYDMSDRAIQWLAETLDVSDKNVVLIGSSKDSNLLKAPYLSIEIGEHDLRTCSPGYIAGSSVAEGLRDACRFFGLVNYPDLCPDGH